MVIIRCIRQYKYRHLKSLSAIFIKCKVKNEEALGDSGFLFSAYQGVAQAVVIGFINFIFIKAF